MKKVTREEFYDSIGNFDLCVSCEHEPRSDITVSRFKFRDGGEFGKSVSYHPSLQKDSEYFLEE